METAAGSVQTELTIFNTVKPLITALMTWLRLEALALEVPECRSHLLKTASSLHLSK